jgi:hypothetical protein
LLQAAAVIYKERGNISGLADIANNLGQTHCQLRRFAEGIPNLEAALDYFDQLDLDYLTVEEATDYGRHITDQRLDDDASHRDLVLSRFESATKDPTMERLLQTIILGSTGTLPTTRYLLFWTYYETVFKREADKNTTFRSFFRDHRDAITDLHQLVGMLLQIDCETTGEIHARMPRAQLHDLARQYMLDDGHDEQSATEFVTKVFTVATQRLVLLATDKHDTVSFDVRSLQELMAGCALVDGNDDAIRANLTATALSPHWRNTWLFAAGRLFDGSRHRRDLVLDIVEHCDEHGHWPAWLYPAAPELAAYLLEDGLAAAKPNDQRRLIDTALRCLDGPVPQEPQAVALGLRIASSLRKLHSAHIRNAIAAAHATSGQRQAVARILMHYETYGSSPVPGSYTPKDLQRAADMWRFQIPRVANNDRINIAALLQPAFHELAPRASPRAGELVANALTECDGLILTRTDLGDLWPVGAAQSGPGPTSPPHWMIRTPPNYCRSAWARYRPITGPRNQCSPTPWGGRSAPADQLPVHRHRPRRRHRHRHRNIRLTAPFVVVGPPRDLRIQVASRLTQRPGPVGPLRRSRPQTAGAVWLLNPAFRAPLRRRAVRDASESVSILGARRGC